MAGARRSWAWLLAMAVLLVGAGAAQSVPSQPAASGSIAGRLTDLHSMPVDGALVVLRNEATGAEARTTTPKNGVYGFTGLDAGAYTVEAESEQLGRGRLEGVFVTAGNETRLQTAMQFEIPPPQPIPVVIRDIAPITLTLNTSLAVKPLRQLAISGHFPELPRGVTATVTPVLTETLAAKELLVFPLPMRPLPELAREMPATVTPVGTATLAAEPLRSLPMTGRQLEVKPGVAGSSLAVSAASAGVAQAATPLSQPLKRAQTASQEVDPVTPVVTTTVSGAELQALPASGRRWQEFALDTPTAATAAGGRQQTSLRGAGQEPAETTIDGASIRLAFGGQGGSGPGSSGPGANGQGGAAQNGMGQAWSGGHGLGVAEAAIREVETAAGNVEAKGARTAGGRMNVETQSGANGLHGQGFFFDRQNNWGAQNPFTQWVKQTGPGTDTTPPVFTAEPYTPPDHETVWGLGLGSQIRRNKLFWFAALDSYRRNDPGLATVKHPYLCANAECTEQTGFFAQPSNDQILVLCSRLGLTMQGAARDAALLPHSHGDDGIFPDAGNTRRAARTGSAHGHAVDRFWPSRLAGCRAPPLHAGRDRRKVELAGWWADPRGGNLRKQQFWLQPSQRGVVTRPLGGISHAESAGRDPRFGGARHHERARRDALGLRADAARSECMGAVATDRGGQSLWAYHRQSFALRKGQLSRRTAH